MKILIVAAEVAPFSKTGGLADVASALPQALAGLGHDVAVVTPKYKMVYDGEFESARDERFDDLTFDSGKGKVKGHVEKTFFPGTDVPVFLLVNDHFYKRSGIYVDEEMEAWEDNSTRFAFFDYAAMEISRLHFGKLDILHAHDWHAGLCPVYLRTLYKEDPNFRHTKCLYTIHNLAYQGSFPMEEKDRIGLPAELFDEELQPNVVIWDQINFMKAGIVFADKINTVSKKYSEEIRTEAYGVGLEELLQERADDLTGILNGVDYSEWSPEKDPYIPANYSAEDPAGKRVNKEALQKQNHLPVEPDVPVLGIVSRLAEQKGFDLLEEIFDDMMGLGMQFVLLGTGEKHFHALFEEIRDKYPGRVGINLTFSNPMAHLIEAGADMFLMPSHYEPCGLNQMYSLKYGTVPVVRATGGLADTVRDYNADPSNGNGFVFQDTTGASFLHAVQRAVQVYTHEKDAWQQMVLRGMREDHSWNASANEYIQLFESMRGDR